MKVLNVSNILHFYRMEKNPFGNTANNQLRLGCEVENKKIIFFWKIKCKINCKVIDNSRLECSSVSGDI